MKIKELLEKTIAPKVGSQDFTNALNSDNFLEADLNEESVKSIQEGFGNLITMEAAKNNSQLIEEVKNTYKSQLTKSIFQKLDDPLKQVAEKIGVTFGEEDEIQQKIEALTKAEIKGNGDNVKSITEKYNALQEDFKNYKKSSIEELEKQKSEFSSQRLLDKQVNFLSTNYQIADVYKDMSDMIHKTVIGNVSDKAKISLVNGKFEVRNKENPDLKLFDSGNNEVSFKSLVDQEMSKYLKKSDPDPKRKQEPQFTPPSKTNTLLQPRGQFS